LGVMLAMAACSDEAPEMTSKEGVAPPSSGALPTLDLEAAGRTAQPPEVPMFDFGAVTPPKPVPTDAGKRRIWAIDERRHLLRILADDPSNVIDVALVDMPAPATNDHIVALDFRPTNGTLYVLSTSSRLFTVDLTLAKATPVGAGPTNPTVSGQAHGFDFNPVVDKIRVHTDVDQNLRLDPVTGAVVGSDTMLAFGESDPNFRQSPNLVGTAYTNSVTPTPASTVLYAIDSTRNLLTKVDPPNAGIVSTIGPLGIDIAAMAGFDIWGSGSALEAYAAARIESEQRYGLYRVNLTTGAASLVGPIAHDAPIRGIAVQP
jgi:hypothetical protein